MHKYFKSQSIFSTAFITNMAYIGHDFMRTLDVAFQSTPVHNCPDTCDIACMLQSFLCMLFLATVHTNTLFEALFEVHIYLFSDMPLYGHMVATLELLWNYEFIITNFIENQTFSQKFYTGITKIWNHTVTS